MDPLKPPCIEREENSTLQEERKAVVLKGSETELRFGDVKNNVSDAAASYRTDRSEVGTDAVRKLFGLSKELRRMVVK